MSQKKLSKNLQIRLITSFINRTINSSIGPFIALFFANQVGVAWAGGILVFQTVLGYISNLFGGYLGDNYNESKILFNGQLLQAFVLFLLSISIFISANVLVLLTFYFLHVIFGNLYRSTFNSLMISETTESNRQFAYTLDYLSTNVSLAIGVLIGGVAFMKVPGIFFLIFSIGTAFIGFYIKFAFNYSANVSINNVSQNEKITFTKFITEIFTNYKDPLLNFNFLKYVLGISFITATTLTMENALLVTLHKHFHYLTIQLLNAEIKISVSKFFSYIQIENVLIVVVFTLGTYTLFKTVPLKLKIIISSIVLTLSYALMLFTNSTLIIIFLVLIGSVAEIIFAPGAQALQTELIPLNRKASYSALLSIGNNISQSLAGFAVTLLVFGNLVSMIYTVLVGFSGAILLRLVINSISNSKQNV